MTTSDKTPQSCFVFLISRTKCRYLDSTLLIHSFSAVVKIYNWRIERLQLCLIQASEINSIKHQTWDKRLETKTRMLGALNGEHKHRGVACQWRGWHWGCRMSEEDAPGELVLAEWCLGVRGFAGNESQSRDVRKKGANGTVSARKNKLGSSCDCSPASWSNFFWTIRESR